MRTVEQAGINQGTKGVLRGMQQYRHSHPINIVEHTTKFLILLILPLLRTLILSRDGFAAWLNGAWFDLAVILVILLLGIWRWYRYVYRLDPSGISIKQGVFFPKKRFIQYTRLSVVAVERPYYLLPFFAVRVSADTDGGAPTTPDFQVTIFKSQEEEFLTKVDAPFVTRAELKKVYLPKNFYIAVLSFINSNSLTGVIFAATFISGAGKVVGGEFDKKVMNQLTSLATVIAAGLPPIAAIVGFTVLGGWLLSFLITLVRHLRFSSERQGGRLIIRSGLITKREYHIAVKRINVIELQQSFLTKLFGFYTGFIHSNGYGKRKDELSVLMPAGDGHAIARNLDMLLPEIPLCKTTLKPSLKFLSRFMIPPLSWIGGVSAGLLLLNWLFPTFSDITLYIGIMAQIPCFWYLGVKIVSFFHTGVGETESAYTFCYTYGYKIKTIAVPKKRIVKLTLRRSLFQVMSGCCDLVILTFSEGKKRHVVPNVSFSEAKKIMNVEEYYRSDYGVMRFYKNKKEE